MLTRQQISQTSDKGESKRKDGTTSRGLYRMPYSGLNLPLPSLTHLPTHLCRLRLYMLLPNSHNLPHLVIRGWNCGLVGLIRLTISPAYVTLPM